MEKTEPTYICVNCENSIKVSNKENHSKLCCIKAYDRYIPCRDCLEMVHISQIKDHLLCHDIEKSEKTGALEQEEDEFYDCQNDLEEMRQEESEADAYERKMGQISKEKGIKEKTYDFFFNKKSMGNKILSTIGRRIIGELYYDIEELITKKRPHGYIDNFEFNQDQESDEYENEHDENDINKVIRLLPESKINNKIYFSKDKRNCIICLEDFKIGNTITTLPCTHIFHSECITKWIRECNECPICKFKITKETILQKDFD